MHGRVKVRRFSSEPRLTAFSGNERNSREGVAEHGRGIRTKPLANHGSVDLPEVSGKAQILVFPDIEVGWGAEDGSLQAVSHDKQGGGGAVVGAAAGVLTGTSTEFGKSHGEDLVLKLRHFIRRRPG